MIGLRCRSLALMSVAVITCLIAAASHPTGVRAQTGNTPERPELLVQSSHAERITNLIFSPDLTYLATASVDGTVKLWNLKINRLVRTLPVSSYWVHSIAFSPDSSMLAAGAGDSTITLWDLRSW